MSIVEKHIFGWRVIDMSPAITHCVICVAPHTSNWDFVVGHLACYSLGRRMHFLMKDAWFRGPLDKLFRRMGGIPVNRATANGLTDYLASRFDSSDNFTLVITPEGTRSANAQWKTGFYHIAQKADVPLLLAYLDYETKEICVSEPFKLSGDIEADMTAIKNYFAPHKGKRPDSFKIN